MNRFEEAWVMKTLITLCLAAAFGIIAICYLIDTVGSLKPTTVTKTKVIIKHEICTVIESHKTQMGNQTITVPTKTICKVVD